MLIDHVSEITLYISNYKLSVSFSLFLSILLANGNLTIGLILPYEVGGGQSRPGTFYASALTVAVDNINKDPTLFPGTSLSFIWNDSGCREEESIKALIRQHERRVHAFIGFGCNCSKQARIAAALNLPAISHVSTQ